VFRYFCQELYSKQEAAVHELSGTPPSRSKYGETSTDMAFRADGVYTRMIHWPTKRRMFICGWYARCRKLSSLNLQITSLLLCNLSGIRSYETQVVLDFVTPNDEQTFPALWNKSPELYFESWRFESHRGHGCLFLVSVVCSQVEVSATGRSLVQRSPTELWSATMRVQAIGFQQFSLLLQVVAFIIWSYSAGYTTAHFTHLNKFSENNIRGR
jgi:hypothetical protein